MFKMDILICFGKLKIRAIYHSRTDRQSLTIKIKILWSDKFFASLYTTEPHDPWLATISPSFVAMLRFHPYQGHI